MGAGASHSAASGQGDGWAVLVRVQSCLQSWLPTHKPPTTGTNPGLRRTEFINAVFSQQWTTPGSSECCRPGLTAGLRSEATSTTLSIYWDPWQAHATHS